MTARLHCTECVRQAPTPEEQAAAVARVEAVQDVPVGYGHADRLAALPGRVS